MGAPPPPLPPWSRVQETAQVHLFPRVTHAERVHVTARSSPTGSTPSWRRMIKEGGHIVEQRLSEPGSLCLDFHSKMADSFLMIRG